MCGIIGLYNPQATINRDSLSKMTMSLVHRGPCSNGIKIELRGRLGMGHTRLALVDLSDRANQPMEIEDYLISFNGEIYNYKELRKELLNAGYSFSTSSDTEVIIRAIQKWGISALNKFNGCFAFILYAKRQKKLYIVRDPLGKKQIVYSKAKNGDWIFASEVKALLKHPLIKAEPNIDRFLSDLIFKFFADKKETHFRNIFHVPAGHYFVFDLANGGEPQINKYWDIDNCQHQDLSKIDVKNVTEKFMTLLEDSVRLRMDADTEIGSILSGGIDSSLITKMASLHHGLKYENPFNCFTIKYGEMLNRDIKNARLLCLQMENVRLNEIEITEDIGIEDIDLMTFALEEPLWDKVFIPQFMNYKVVKETGLRAVLNGQGADELWLGYLYFYDLLRLPESEINYSGLQKYWMRQCTFSNFIKSPDIIDKVKGLIADNLMKNFVPYESSDKTNSLVRFSIKTHLQEMFMQEDRLSMANSVEVRLPHVDLRLVDLALSIPSSIKILHKKEKYILRTAAKHFLPGEICSRRKMAFPDPPAKYDRHIEAFFNKREALKSEIVSEIFKGNVRSFFYELPIRDRWKLLAISRMEKVFF